MFFRRYASSFAKWMTVKEAINSNISGAPRENTLVKGWVTSIRQQKKHTFIHVNDGTSSVDLQIVANTDLIKNDDAKITYGSSIEAIGTLSRSTHPAQPVELLVTKLELLGECNTKDYPFKARTVHSLDYTRQYPHFRTRTKHFSTILRIRNNAVMAVHDFFQKHNYTHIHTPIITSNDCEGAGELFQIIPIGDLNKGPGSDRKFFNNKAYLTVSGQLHAEAAMCGLSKVYSFGPTFRAEKSHTSRHLAEFYMLEAETVLKNSNNGQEELMEISESLCKHVLHSLVTQLPEEMSLIQNGKDAKGVVKKCIDVNYKRITYGEAIEVLRKNYDGVTPNFGEDLNTDNEKFIVDYFGSQPVFVTDYPAAIKPFYAKPSTHDNSMAQAIDLLMPGIGEVVGGTVREDNYLLLKEKLSQYLDLRKYGSIPHGGFGLGFDRLLQVALGITNIRDVVLFPRCLSYCQM